MSPQSQKILFDEILAHQAARAANPDGEPDPAPLQAAAHGHLGASRSLPELLDAYARAMENAASHTPDEAAVAQALADELTPVRIATRITAGILPGTGVT